MLSNIENELDEKLRLYAPSCLSSPSSFLIAAANETKRRNLALADAYKITNTEFEKYKRRARSNNWLKMHGYPMRRKYHK